ncbi:hypothetical protein EOA79_02515 [Mesorhizobium sp. M1A.F.Ca.IN.020.03.2.1]|uniref:hypothetical protein n=1 Tax=Mesorhizobium sp. M1A.F.Ca.IN.020.03.2.1 TaxID=2496769 RepID=UPI000FD230EB|nr:hypothetical protein [Mesorhizobium sp. M1A.F.Ca.IN.020.03.2.1]RUV07981.1 hypothetical protein EOA79_02515 [Mesorhizobium sp. M1A.F.Ca.IN.020.03.2.1]
MTSATTDRISAEQLRLLADDAFDVLNWAKRLGLPRERQVDETVKAFEVRLGYREANLTYGTPARGKGTTALEIATKTAKGQQL